MTARMYGPKVMLVIHDDAPAWFAFFAEVMNLAGAVTNPLLYVTLHRAVRVEIRKLFRRRLAVVHDVGRNSLLPIIRY